MDFQNDPELEKLFKDELDERAGSLRDGARAMAAAELTPELSGRMLREGHTIKGTGRVMGYEAIARGGETCELVWRWVQQGDIQPSSMLARTLEHLAEAIPHAIGGDARDVSIAIDAVRTLVIDETLLSQLPEPLDLDEPDAFHEAPAEEFDPVGEVLPEPTSEAEEPPAPEAEMPPAPEAAAPAPEAEGPSEPRGTFAPDDSASIVGPDIDADDLAEMTASLEHIAREEAHPTPVDVEPAAQSPEPTIAAGDDGTAGEETLVFEPGPSGKLATPTITYEIVSSAFADAPTPTAADDAEEAAESSGPPALALVDTPDSVLNPTNDAVYDLGGLVGAVETWATEESVPVNAGRLFRMINDVAALRIDLESAIAQAAHLIHTADGVSTAAVEGSLEALETVRRASLNLQGAALGLTSTPLSGVMSTLPQLVKYLAKRVGRDIQLVVEGEETAIDRQLVDRVGEVIRQLVVNAVAHGIEAPDRRTAIGKASHGQVKVSLSRDEQHLQIIVSDDGAGIDWKTVRERALSEGLVSGDPSTDELRSVLYSDGFSTNPGSSDFTGDGDGLHRVTNIVEEVFGTMNLDSTPGRGTTFVVTMPTHRALQAARIFTAGGKSWGIPDSSVRDVVGLPDVTISVTERGSFIGYNGESIPYSSFATVVGLDVEGLPAQVMVVQSPTGAIALAVDDVVALAEVATKDLGPLLSGSDSVVSGVALLGGDDTVMLVDAGRLAEKMREVEARPEGPVHTVLVVDDSQGVRQVVSGVLASHGFSTLSAGSVSDALAVLAKHTVDALVVDFSMPRADGVALIHMVRQRYGDIPVVMLSGVASDEDRQRAERAGADAFFDKADFAKGALVEKLRELVSSETRNGTAEIAS